MIMDIMDMWTASARITLFSVLAVDVQIEHVVKKRVSTTTARELFTPEWDLLRPEDIIGGSRSHGQTV